MKMKGTVKAMVRGGIGLVLFLAVLARPSSMASASVAARDDASDVCRRAGGASGETTTDVDGKDCIVDVDDNYYYSTSSSSAAAITSVFVIGDLHGDAICAVSWVNRTGLIANLLRDEEKNPSSSTSNSAASTPTSFTLPLYERLNDPSKWTWTNDKATLVFMGDYVDKGPTARQTVEFVRDLTLAFPYVTAILGNHEIELLRDRDERIKPAERYSAYSYATVHPGDYHNYIQDRHSNNHVQTNQDKGAISEDAAQTTTTPSTRDLDEKDALVLDLLYAASMEVYSFNAHAAVRNVPSLQLPPTTDDTEYYRQRGIHYAITDIIPPEHRELAIERLTEYQNAYLDTYRSGSLLGSWMESRPIAHLAENINTLFVHGGVSSEVGKLYFANGREGVKRLNAAWYEHSHESKLYDFLRGSGGSNDNDMHLGEAVYDLMTYRGNHPGYADWESHGTYDDDDTDETEVCKNLHDMLQSMDGIDRIAVGHTPDFDIRNYCDGEFLALDSTLGRWIRGSGNEYCPGPEHFANRNGDIEGISPSRTSRNGRYTCEEIKEVCEGQIVRLDSDGSVNILTML